MFEPVTGAESPLAKRGQKRALGTRGVAGLNKTLKTWRCGQDYFFDAFSWGDGGDRSEEFTRYLDAKFP